MRRLVIAAIAILTIVIAVVVTKQSAPREGFTSGLFAGASRSLADFLPNPGPECGAPALTGGFVEAYADTRSQQPCGVIDITPYSQLALTPETVSVIERDLGRMCRARPGWFVAQAQWACPSPPRTKEGFYWAQWGNVPMERENFSPDAPGACAQKSIAAYLESEALRVADGR